MGRFFVIVLISITFLLLTCPSFAVAYPEFEFFPRGGYSSQPTLDKIRLGRVRIQPGLALESKYTDNVFLTADKTFANGSSEGKVEDLVISIKPSLFLDLQRTSGEVFGFNFFFVGEDQNYADLTDLDFFNFDIGGALNFGGPGGRSDFNLGGHYFRTNAFTGQDFRTNVGDQIRVKGQIGFANFVYSLSKMFKMQLEAELRQHRFEEDFSEQQDVDIYSFSASAFKRTNRILSYGLKYVHQKRNYLNLTLASDSSVSNQGYILIKFEPNQIIKGKFSVGYEWKKFKRFSREDLQTPILQVEFTYQPVKRTKLTLTGTREISDSTFQTIQTFIYSHVNLDFSQKMGKKFTLKAIGQLKHHDYRRPALDIPGGNIFKTRIDVIIKGSASLIYDIKDWLQVKAKYIYEKNDSNFDDNDFLVHTGLLEISVKY